MDASRYLRSEMEASPFVTHRSPIITSGPDHCNSGGFLHVLRSEKHTAPMKHLITRPLLALATVFTFTHAKASEPATPLRAAVSAEAMQRTLDHQIDRYVSYPLRSAAMDGDVYVSFVIDTEGKVEVLSAHSNNDDLCAYVLERLARIDIGSNPGGLWKTTHMHFRFHPEV